MMRSFWIQLIAISVLFTALSGAVSFAIFRSASAHVSQESRRNVYLFLANILESAPYDEALRQYERFRSDSPTVGRGIWVISNDNRILASNTQDPPPSDWLQMEKPKLRHAFTVKVPRLGYFAELVLVKLDKPEPTYLLVRPEKDSPNKTLAGVEIQIFLLSLFGTTFSGLAVVFVYMRRTSREARQVIASMQAGNLQARFPIQRFDQISSLKLDFNAMADQIESLIGRLTASETARRQMLEELSHDLRTPLTSLRTSIETLAMHRQKMSDAQQEEFLEVAQAELNYFVRILEDLLLIAEVSEPGHNASLASSNLETVLDQEMVTRRTSTPKLSWTIEKECPHPATVALLPHLLLRVLRNALDNAGKYASSKVSVHLQTSGDQVRLTIIDDGTGMSDEEISNYGQRRKVRSTGGSTDPTLSLGLGSVIIKTIVDAYGGKVELGAAATAPDSGTMLRISFPRVDLA